MDKDSSKFLNELYKDCETYLKTYARAYCREAKKELTKTAKYAIQQFYNDYTPRYYVRTNNLLRRSYKSYYKDNGRQVYGGVYITSENMFENYDGVSANYVMEAGWSGWHGMKGSDYINNWELIPNIRPIYTEPPINIVKDKKDDEKFQEKLSKKADKIARSQGYYHLNKLLGF